MNWQFWHEHKNRPADCCGVEPLLSLYADGAASPSEAERAKSHILECEDCRRHYQWITETSRTLALRPIVSPPADLSVRIAQAIAAEDARTRQRFVRRPLVFRTAYATAASLLVVAAFATQNYFSKTPSAPPRPLVASKPHVALPMIHHPVSASIIQPGKTTENLAAKPSAVHSLQNVKPIVSNVPQEMARVPTENAQPKLHPSLVRETMPPVRTARTTETNPRVSVPGTHPVLHHPVKSIVSTHQQELVAIAPKNSGNTTPSTSAPTLPTPQPTTTTVPTVVAEVPTAPIHTVSLDTNSMLRSHIPPPQMVSGKVSGSPRGSVHMASEYGTDSFDNGVSNRSGTVPTVHSQ